jgi:hypothetical protein
VLLKQQLPRRLEPLYQHFQQTCSQGHF